MSVGQCPDCKDGMQFHNEDGCGICNYCFAGGVSLPSLVSCSKWVRGE